jgi:hypothetical protein
MIKPKDVYFSIFFSIQKPDIFQLEASTAKKLESRTMDTRAAKLDGSTIAPGHHISVKGNQGGNLRCLAL